MTGSQSTQRGKILELLTTACGGWVPLPQIMECAAQYNARIFELRRMGYRIENRTRKVNGARHSWFRLVCSPPELKRGTPTAPLTAAPTAARLTEIEEPTAGLFQLAELERAARWEDHG